jgi:GT2 family glycosyltransferase
MIHRPGGDPAGKNPITIFVISWGRPIYLWTCLDAIWRLTKSATRVILLDNAHPDPLVTEVISAFERRGLFSEVVRFSTNAFTNVQSAYRERLHDIGPLHVYMDSDAVLCDRPGCWLADMLRILEDNPQIGMLGSLIDTRDFVDAATALRLTNGDAESAEFLAKLRSPERGFIDAPEWANPKKDFFYLEPPCPIGNPPGRLTLLRTDVMQEVGFEADAALAASFRQRGMKPALTAQVRHRHMSLLNLFDYHAYERHQRDFFFKGTPTA